MCCNKLSFHSDPPSAPGAPRGLESTEDSITIQWNRPRHDGGSSIQGYTIERRQVGENQWIKANHAMVKDLTYRVINLIEHREYEFRVAAINAAGQGPWSDPSENIKCISFRKLHILSFKCFVIPKIIFMQVLLRSHLI